MKPHIIQIKDPLFTPNHSEHKLLIWLVKIKHSRATALWELALNSVK